MALLRCVYLFSLCLSLFFSQGGHAEEGPIRPQDQSLINLIEKNHLRLIVMRHGQAVHNLNHLMSSSPSPGIYLTGKGISQVKDAAQKLRNEPIEVIYVSPTYRAMQTAQLLSMDLGIPAQNILIDDRIREQYYGTYEGRPWDEYEAYFPSPDDVYTGAVPGGESGCEVLARALDFLRSIACKYQNKTLLIVTHSFVYGQINFALAGAYDDIPQAGYKIYPVIKGQ